MIDKRSRPALLAEGFGVQRYCKSKTKQNKSTFFYFEMQRTLFKGRR